MLGYDKLFSAIMTCSSLLQTADSCHVYCNLTLRPLVNFSYLTVCYRSFMLTPQCFACYRINICIWTDHIFILYLPKHGVFVHHTIKYPQSGCWLLAAKLSKDYGHPSPMARPYMHHNCQVTAHFRLCWFQFVTVSLYLCIRDRARQMLANVPQLMHYLASFPGLPRFLFFGSLHSV